jgi:hypothetical protein
VTDELFGVWGGRPPGGWCYFHLPNPEHPHSGTREEAERTLAVFKGERPDTPYEIIPFDPEKEPEPWPCRVTLVQLRALADIDAEGHGAQHMPASRGGFGKSTYDALMDRGLIMSTLHSRPRPAFRLTRAGRAALDKQRHMLRKA